MRLIMLVAWLVAVAYGIPILVVYDTVPLVEYGNQVTFCVNTGGHLYFHIRVIVNFALWYCVPLLLMCVLYARISMVLGHSTLCNSSDNTFMEIAGSNHHYAADKPPDHDKQVTPKVIVDGAAETDTNHPACTPQDCDQHTTANNHLRQTCSTPAALAGRRRVIRLLIAICLCFAACMLPHHVRLLYELCATPTSPPTFGHHLVPPITFLMFYLNSVLNPVLYAFLSANFRMRLKEALGLGIRERQNAFALNTGSVKTSKGTNYRPV